MSCQAAESKQSSFDLSYIMNPVENKIETIGFRMVFCKIPYNLAVYFLYSCVRLI